MELHGFIKLSLTSSAEWMKSFVNDLKDAPLAQPTAKGGNHATWILGHIIVSESLLLDVFVRGEENRYPEWGPLFLPGTTPSTDGSLYPSLDELLAEFENMRAATLAHLDTLSAEDMDKISSAPEEFAERFGTIGACFAVMTTHVGFHAGQLSDIRRSLGRDPLAM